MSIDLKLHFEKSLQGGDKFIPPFNPLPFTCKLIYTNNSLSPPPVLMRNLSSQAVSASTLAGSFFSSTSTSFILPMSAAPSLLSWFSSIIFTTR